MGLLLAAARERLPLTGNSKEGISKEIIYSRVQSWQNSDSAGQNLQTGEFLEVSVVLSLELIFGVSYLLISLSIVSFCDINIWMN